MKHLDRAMVLIALVALTPLGPAFAQNAYPDPYRAVDHWAQLPAGRTFGKVIGVQVDPDGKSIWAFERCGGGECTGSNLAPILKFDPSGKLVQSFGAGLFIQPHGFTIDRDGNLWTSDADGKDGKGDQVIEFDLSGKELRRLGKAGVAGDTKDTFDKPTAVAVAANGSIFVADGHGKNDRIVKFDKDGHFVTAWGQKGKGPSEFDTPHAMAIDSQGRLFVADRGNSRLQLFDQDGKFLAEWRQFGRPSGIYITSDDMMYVTDSESNEKINPGFIRGIWVGNAKDGSRISFIPAPSQVSIPADCPEPGTGAEGVAADAAGNVYGGETACGRTLRKYAKK
jgi:DNA-binding beta-propeller fold protein YncE